MSTAANIGHAGSRKVSVRGPNHLAVPVRDRAEGFRFWQSLLDAKLVVSADDDNFTFMVLPDGFYIGLAELPGNWTQSTLEFPHFGFEVAPEMMEPLRERLQALGVPTQEIWTRFRIEALMYFRDPSGNLFEAYCSEGYPKVNSIPVGGTYGGTYKNDLQALYYDSWNDPGK